MCKSLCPIALSRGCCYSNVEDLLAAKGENVQRDGATIEYTSEDTVPHQVAKLATANKADT
jgi:hypothetical protein